MTAYKGHPTWLGKAMHRGGRSPQWQGEGDRGKALKEKAASYRKDDSLAGKAVGSGAMTGLGIAGAIGARSKVGKLIGAGLAALGAKGAGETIGEAREDTAARRNADAAYKAGEEAEGRKRGGRAKRKS